MIWQNLANSIKVTFEEVFIWFDIEWLSILAHRLQSHRIKLPSRWSSLLRQSACLLKVSTHKFLVSGKSASMWTLHSKESVLIGWVLAGIWVRRSIELGVMVGLSTHWLLMSQFRRTILDTTACVEFLIWTLSRIILFNHHIPTWLLLGGQICSWPVDSALHHKYMLLLECWWIYFDICGLKYFHRRIWLLSNRYIVIGLLLPIDAILLKFLQISKVADGGIILAFTPLM